MNPRSQQRTPPALRRAEAQSEAAFMGRTSAMAVVVRNVEQDIGIQVAC